MKKVVLSLLLGAFSFSAYAENCRRMLIENIEGLREEDLQKVDSIHPSTSEVLGNFYEISRIYRASKFESKIREFLIGEAKKYGFSHDVDEAGNFVIRIPSNQKNPKAQPWIALQSHVDMVASVKGLESRPENEAFLAQNGGVLPFEYRNGSIQSVGNRNTIGNDNGSGVAIMMEYMRNPNLVHPNLELVFTVAEEDGLIGASKFSIPLNSKKMISLDSGATNVGLIGANGAARQRFSRESLKRTALPANAEIFSINLSGLLGGHSGLKIQEGRANAVREMASLLLKIKEEIPDTAVIDLRAGVEDKYNVIPNGFNVELALDPSSKAKLDNLIQDFKGSFSERYRKIENLGEFKIEVKTKEASGEKAVYWSDVTPLFDFVLNMHDGASGDTWGALNISRLSTNMSFLILDTNGVRGGMMPRFYETASFKRLTEENLRLKDEFIPDFGWEDISFSPEWRASEGNLSGQVLQNAHAVGLPDFKLDIAGGSIEPSEFTRIFPDLEVITIGVETPNAHEPTEQFPIRDLAYILRLLDLTLQQSVEN